MDRGVSSAAVTHELYVRSMTHQAVERAHRFLEDGRAEQALRLYLDGSFTGGYFDTAGRFSGDIPSPAPVVDPRPNEMTIEDVLALALMGKRVDFRLVHAVRELNSQVAPHLEQVSVCLEIQDAPDVGDMSSEPWGQLSSAFDVVRQAKGIGRVYASKLLSRKRPQLIPIWDRFVQEGLGMIRADNDWVVMQAVVRSSEDDLRELQSRAAPHLSLLRILDAVIWVRAGGVLQLDDPALARDLYLDLSI